jgi:DNA polymerase-3 subunit gamma/tau
VTTRAEPARTPAQPLRQPQALRAGPVRPVLRRFEDVVEQARAERNLPLVHELERHVVPLDFDTGRIEIALTPEAAPDLPKRLGETLRAWTGELWLVAVTSGEGRTLHEARADGRATLLEEVRGAPLVREVLDRFPGAEIVDVRETARPADDEIGMPEPPTQDLDLTGSEDG